MKRSLILSCLFLLLLSLAASQSSRAEGEAWQPVTGPYGGSVAALVLSPNYPVDHTVFAGVRGRGVYRTTNGGSFWQPVSPAGWVVTDLAISPAYAADQTLLAAAGLPTTGFNLYRSTDEGQSWQDVSPAWSSLPGGLRLAISPHFAVDQTVYAVGGFKTYVSTNGGAGFTPAGGWFASHAVIELAFSPAYAADQTLFALVQGDGLYKSINGGTDWELTGLTGSVGSLAVSPDYANDHLLIATRLPGGQLHRSTDGGVSWPATALTLNPGGEHSLLFSPTFAADGLILAASSADPGPYRSTNRGETWSPVGWYNPAEAYRGGFIGGSVLALAVAPNTAADAAAFAGTSSGMYRSNNRGENWYQRNQGLARLTVRALALAPGNPAVLLAGTSFFEHLRVDAGPREYDGNLQLSLDGGQHWQDVSGRLDRVQQIAFSPGFASDRTILAATGTIGQHGFADGGVYRSTDGGQNWTETLADRVVETMAPSPNFPADRTAWASLFTNSSALGIYHSTDSGQNWQPLAPAVHAQVLAASPNYAVDRTLFAGTADAGLQKSTDGGASWSQVLPHWITALAVSPAYGASQTLYAAGKADAGAPGLIYRSRDGGQSWQQLETGIPASQDGEAVTISELIFASDGSILAGTFYGFEADQGAVYRSSDGGDTWQALGSGLSDYTIFALANEPGQALTFYTGSDGGLWQLEVPQGEPAEAGSWVSHGPAGGKAQALAVSPAFAGDGVAFSGEWLSDFQGTEGGLGIFKSTDEGRTWQPAAQGTEGVQYSSAVHAFAFSPAFSSDQTVFAATGGGLFKSTGGGDRWEWLNRAYFGPPGAITAVAVAPDYPTSGHVLASGGYGGLFLSQDGGRNWTANNSLPSAAAIVYSPDFAQDGLVWAAGSGGLYQTVNAGLNWSPVLTSALAALAVSPQYGSDGLIFAGGDVLYMSDDGGANWDTTPIAADFPRVSALAISPAFATDRTLFAGNRGGLYQSPDGGASWQRVTGYPGGPVLTLAMSPGWPAHAVLLAGTAEGVYRTADGGATWTLTPGMAALTTLSLAVDGQLLLAGATNHGVYASDCLSDGCGGQSWTPLGLQEGMTFYDIPAVAISPAYATDGTLFAAWRSSVSIGGSIYRTTDRGTTWERVYSTDYVSSLAISPQYAADQTVYATGNNGRVVGSTDDGQSWGQVGAWPAGMGSPGMTQIALPPNYPAERTLFAAGNEGFWRLSPGATTWEPAASGLNADINILALTVSPNYATDRTLLVAGSWLAGPNLNQQHGLFRSTDGGLNWVPANAGLPNVRLTGLVFSPGDPTGQTAYLVSTEGQLYRSLDSGRRWTAIGGPPERPGFYDVGVTQAGEVYVASSAGVWRYTTPVQNILVNGGFEAGSGWELPQTAWPAGYTGRIVYDERQAMRIGIDNGPHKFAYSSARQVVTIPAQAGPASLSFDAYPVSGEAVTATQSQVWPQERVIDRAAEAARAAGGDAQYVLILRPDTGAIQQTLWWERSNAQAWQQHTFDLTAYAGQTVLLHFGVYNDGRGGRTGLYVDNISLLVPHAAGRVSVYLPVIRQN